MTTLMTTTRAALGGALALALAPAFWPSDAAAHTCDAPFSTDLVTAKGIDVGEVKVCNDAEFLTVTYQTTWPWCVLRTNLHVARDLAGIPRIRLLGIPNFLRFDFIEEVDCAVPAPIEIPLDEIDGGVVSGDTVTIAARAVVEGEGPDGTHPRCLLGDKCVAWGEGTRFRPRLPAMYFTYAVQAPPPATSCVCDSRTGTGGTPGALILEQLCSDGSPRPGVSFQESTPGQVPLTQVSNSNPQTLLYLVRGDDPMAGVPPVCRLQDTFGTFTSTDITSGEFEACRAHLRVSCGQPEP
jgi:hypothetical protein